MGTAHVDAARTIAATPETVYAVLADYTTHHARIMPPGHFSDLEVESGGVGDGTVFHITASVAGKKQRLHMRVGEPTPGQVLTETNLDTGVVTAFEVSSDGERGARVRMSSEWETHGVKGWIDGLVSPHVLHHMFVEQLEQLDTYIQSGEVQPA